jgi:DNA-binding MarR family transcriptional regulator
MAPGSAITPGTIPDIVGQSNDQYDWTVMAFRGYVPRRVGRLPSWLLASATRHGHRLVGEHLAGEGLRRQHYLVLAGLAELDAPAQAEVGRLLRVDGSDLVAILNDLESAGYVRRRPSSTDRRRNTVSLTQHGHDALRRLDAAVEAANDELLAALSPLERELFVSLLIRVLISAEGSTVKPDEPQPTRRRPAD